MSIDFIVYTVHDRDRIGNILEVEGSGRVFERYNDPPTSNETESVLIGYFNVDEYKSAIDEVMREHCERNVPIYHDIGLTDRRASIKLNAEGDRLMAGVPVLFLLDDMHPLSRMHYRD